MSRQNPSQGLVVEDTEPNVYIVDDDEAVRDSLKLLLEAYGMAVADYGSTAEFARAYVPGGKACLILDLHLPGTSGLDYLAAQESASAELPVIIPGRGDQASRARAERMRVLAVLDKPDNIRQALGGV